MKKFAALCFILMCFFAYTTWYLYDQQKNSACESIKTGLEQLAEDGTDFIEKKVDEL